MGCAAAGFVELIGSIVMVEPVALEDPRQVLFSFLFPRIPALSSLTLSYCLYPYTLILARRLSQEYETNTPCQCPHYSHQPCSRKPNYTTPLSGRADTPNSPATLPKSSSPVLLKFNRVAYLQGHVSRIAVCLLSESQRVLERFVFSTESLPTISSVFLDRPAVAQNGRNVTEAESVESLRAAIVRFIRAAEGLKPLPSGTTWCVRLSFKADHDRPGNYHSWIAAQQETDEKEWLLHSRTIPVQNINIGPVLFEAWVEA
ncbi:DNA polymerase zeta Rev7 [Schizosaccharomyces japonicus yFS275]|uniref:DNA polymerase zeta Rev7 n=1 Tax=Schizosaccharomyces japonicus (strain yFS275 / FY16936) TaxID=402676 RepID=B6JW42_SCHJY|nr:DNA polymerase zeta Rev7 [Schizosaccharomyces japonicus yFS275]EEB05593.1 DNA polymerase zeta Rev7 [Schizosaccharomyces japonicus yFS275]